MKRIISILLLSLCLLVMPIMTIATGESVTGENAIGVRAIYKTTCETLGEDNYYIYANCLGFPIAAAEDTVYFLTDAALYDFTAIVKAAKEEIRPFFEENQITGLDDSDYAGEFTCLGASIEVCIDGESYTPRLLYDSDTYVVIVVSGLSEITTAKYTEQNFAGRVTGYSVLESAFGFSTEPPELESTIESFQTELLMDEDTGDFITSKEITSKNVGSPLLTPEGVICGFICFDAESGLTKATELSGLTNTFKRLGIDPNTADISDEQKIASSSAAEAKTETAESEQNSGLFQSPVFQKIIIAVTVVAGLLIIAAISLLIVRSRNLRRRAKARAARRTRLQHSASIVRPSAVYTGGIPKPVEHDKSDIPQHSAARSYTVQENRNVSVQERLDSTRKLNTERVMLAVLEGSLKGFTLYIADTVCIGRDPKVCRVVFDNRITEISRCHCKLTYQPDTNDLILEDLHSANGTYTPDGRRYAAGHRYLLHSGDRFYLGTKENMIEVRKI